MVTLRCTAKLLAKLGIPKRLPSPPPPDNALGDWYANILYSKQGHYIVTVSDRSNLAIVLEARRLNTLVPRFLSMLSEVLTWVAIDQEAVAREVALTSNLAFGPTANRNAVGYLNRIVEDLRFMLPLRPNFTIYDWCKYFSERPFGDPAQFPEQVARNLLRSKARFSIIRGGNA